MATATQKEVATYYAKGRNTRLVRRPEVIITTPTGQQLKQQDPLRYEFEPDGWLTVEEGQDLLPTGPRGEDEDAITWLERHRLFNIKFWREGQEPDRPQPVEEDVLQWINESAVALDDEHIAKLLQQERDTHDRPVVVKSAERAIATVIDAKRQIKEMEAEEKKAAKGDGS